MSSETDADKSGVPQIEVTPEMIQAGAETLQREVFDSVAWEGGFSELLGRDVAMAVWTAMCAKARCAT